jgi:sigma-B regulation protein RsbU (phosphoserine phosphatase)
MYTDGMVEAHNDDGEEFGTGRLSKAFVELRDRPADEIARELVKRVSEWSGGKEPEDDLTVVILKRHFGSAPAVDDRIGTSGAFTVPKNIAT